jgi:hypothetical protein
MKDVELPFMMAGKYQVLRSVVDVKATNDNGGKVTEHQLTYMVHLINQQTIVLQNFRSMISVNVGSCLPDTYGMLGIS